MTSLRKAATAAALASAVWLGGCAYDDYGYGGVNVGYGGGYYYDDCYGCGPYAPFGWYDGYYYPGNGYWLYDRRGTRHRWTDRQRDYWQHRREHSGGNWHGPATRPWQPDMRTGHRWNENRTGDQSRTWHRRNDSDTAAPPRPQRSYEQAPNPAPSGDAPRRRGGWHRGD